MSSLTTYDALRTWLEANWPGTALRFENETAYAPDGAAPFVYLEVRGNVFGQIAIGAGAGGNLWREQGIARFHICVPSGTGCVTARGYKSALVEMLKGLRLAPGIVCRQIAAGIGGPFKGDGNYFALPVTTFWQRDETA